MELPMHKTKLQKVVNSACDITGTRLHVHPGHRQEAVVYINVCRTGWKSLDWRQRDAAVSPARAYKPGARSKDAETSAVAPSGADWGKVCLHPMGCLLGLMPTAALLWCCALQVVLRSGTSGTHLDSHAVRDAATSGSRAFQRRGIPLVSARGPLDGTTGFGKKHHMLGKKIPNSEPVSNTLEMDRSERSPRRCVRHLESCFGHTLPCCDLCAFCYCRFFNAICYCRKIGNDCHQGKN
ncbi:uncharacterized protein [Narcine bancroftii]|uniref:uncharacterized protein n=1 Tax=Narcine bancroftii TaxID=1343680 RepID=UPI0038316BFB